LSTDYTRFLRQARAMLATPDKESFDQLQLRDGRLFEQYSKPQRVNNRSVGRVWSFRDITARKRAEREMEEMHRQLLDTSRQAGMAEVATSVLHNVGNVLNSVNISCAHVTTLIKKSKVENLSKVAELLKEHVGDIGTFLTSDPKGRQVTDYIGQLAQHLIAQQSTALQELARLQDNVDHIKDIVVMQQGYAKISGIVETLTITSLIEDAVRLNQSSLDRNGVELIREYEDVAPMEVEKHKILQILVNLISNAANACAESPCGGKRVILRLAARGDRLRVSIVDNGVGIPAENLKRIFGHGFTTRKDGHGFGLHSAALAAKEMRGSLLVQSDGPNTGATFTLELPYIRASPDENGCETQVETSGAMVVH
jgi:signal transduction histidine kinase